MIEFDPTIPIFSKLDGELVDQITEKVESCVTSIEHEALSVPIQTFALNVEAVLRLLDLPWYVAAYGAGYNAGYTMRLIKEHFSNENQASEGLESALESNLKSTRVPMADVGRFLLSQEGMLPAVRSLLSFSTLAVWTALETLAKDTWVESLNLCAVPLAQNALNAQGSESKRNESKSIKASWIAKYGFDLRRHMGTLLAEDEERFKFGSPREIVEAYKSAFRTRGIDQMWTPLKEDLDMLNLTRNLVAHKAAIVDKRFNGKVGVDLPIGEPLPLNIVNVPQFVNVAVEAGSELLEFVGAWFDAYAKDSAEGFELAP